MDMPRIVLAIAASFCILLGWNQLSIYMGWMPDPAVQQTQSIPEQQGGGQAGGDGIQQQGKRFFKGIAGGVQQDGIIGFF